MHQFLFFRLDLMEMVKALVRMKEITTPTPKVDEMSRATQQRLLLTGENPEVEGDPQLPGDPP